MEDFQIISLFLARDETAITEIRKKYGKLCLHIAHNILSNVEDAEECAQDTYLTLWNKIPPAQPENLSAYLCRVTRNLALKKLEYNTADKRNANACISLSELETILPDDRLSPDMDSEELSRLLSTFLMTEKPSARKVFIRRYWFFDSVEDIARMFDFSEAKVKSILFRTRNRLRDFLKKEGVEV